jgi:hypothetical protein
MISFHSSTREIVCSLNSSCSVPPTVGPISPSFTRIATSTRFRSLPQQSRPMPTSHTVHPYYLTLVVIVNPKKHDQIWGQHPSFDRVMMMAFVYVQTSSVFSGFQLHSSSRQISKLVWTVLVHLLSCLTLIRASFLSIIQLSYGLEPETRTSVKPL